MYYVCVILFAMHVYACERMVKSSLLGQYISSFDQTPQKTWPGPGAASMLEIMFSV